MLVDESLLLLLTSSSAYNRRRGRGGVSGRAHARQERYWRQGAKAETTSAECGVADVASATANVADRLSKYADDLAAMISVLTVLPLSKPNPIPCDLSVVGIPMLRSMVWLAHDDGRRTDDYIVRTYSYVSTACRQHHRNAMQCKQVSLARCKLRIEFIIIII